MYAHDMLVRRGLVNTYVGMFKNIFLKKIAHQYTPMVFLK